MKLCMGCMRKINENDSVCPFCGYMQGQPPKEPYFLPPETVLHERYAVGRVLGHGGFGITYIGYDAMLERTIAIKEYFPSGLVTRQEGTMNVSTFSGTVGSQYQAGLKSFIDEAKRLAIFSGVPAIVDIYDCFLANGTGYIVMELLKGQTLKEYLARNHSLPYEEAERIILEVLSGLEVVHKEGIVHRDIAPDNVYLVGDPNKPEERKVKLIDFGAARTAVMGEVKSISVMLKPGYAPAEQYSSHGSQGPWTDIYAVGATFYKMITGERPDDSTSRALEDHLIPPSGKGVRIPANKEEALMRSLAVRYDMRIQSAGEFAALLKQPDTDSSGAVGNNGYGGGSYGDAGNNGYNGSDNNGYGNGYRGGYGNADYNGYGGAGGNGYGGNGRGGGYGGAGSSGYGGGYNGAGNNGYGNAGSNGYGGGGYGGAGNAGYGGTGNGGYEPPDSERHGPGGLTIAALIVAMLAAIVVGVYAWVTFFPPDSASETETETVAETITETPNITTDDQQSNSQPITEEGQIIIIN